VLKLGRKKLPQHNTVVAERLARTLLANQPFLNNIASAFLFHPRLASFLLNKMAPDKHFAATFTAMLHNTANPTTIQAGEKTNVIPSIAKVEVDGRFLPGQTTESFLAEVKNVVGPHLEINVINELQPSMVNPNDPIMESIARVLRGHDPDAIALPIMISATTNAAHYSKLNTKYFGFSPVKFDNGDNFQAMFHGNNERIPIEGFHFGIRVLAELVEEICT
jgi:acetylornithine deacetylase/succinyl-diaminopimelate desuccinylase-like protein